MFLGRSGASGCSLLRRNVSLGLHTRPHNVNEDPEKPRESRRSDNLSSGACLGLEFVISGGLVRLRRKPGCGAPENTPEVPFAFTPQAAAKDIDFVSWKTEQASECSIARKLDERRMPWRWSLKSRNQVYSGSGLRRLSGLSPAPEEPQTSNLATM
jgi:hypothetical protein